MTEGASAILLTSQPTPVKVSGIGHATDTSSLRHRASFTSFNSTKEAALKAYSMAQLNPSDIQFGEVHDAFTLFEIIGTEDLGLFRPGEGWKALEEGITHFRGRLPINPSGGLKARGHPVGASGLAQLVEIVWQLRGEAGEGRQLEKAEIGLAPEHWRAGESYLRYHSGAERSKTVTERGLEAQLSSRDKSSEEVFSLSSQRGDWTSGNIYHPLCYTRRISITFDSWFCQNKGGREGHGLQSGLPLPQKIEDGEKGPFETERGPLSL